MKCFKDSKCFFMLMYLWEQMLGGWKQSMHWNRIFLLVNNLWNADTNAHPYWSIGFYCLIIVTFICLCVIYWHLCTQRNWVKTRLSIMGKCIVRDYTQSCTKWWIMYSYHLYLNIQQCSVNYGLVYRIETQLQTTYRSDTL